MKTPAPPLSNRYLLFHCVVLALLTLSIPAPAFAGEIHKIDITVTPHGDARIYFPGEASSYYVLQESSEVTGPFVPAQMALGSSGDIDFLVANLTNTATRFFMIQQRSLSAPVDTDGDGVDDVSELLYFTTRDPLNPNDGVTLSPGYLAVEPVEPQHVTAGSMLQVQLRAFGSAPVTFSPVSLPRNAHVNPTTGLFTFVPDEDQTGVHEVVIQARAGDLEDEAVLQVTVHLATAGGFLRVPEVPIQAGKEFDVGIFLDLGEDDGNPFTLDDTLGTYDLRLAFDPRLLEVVNVRAEHWPLGETMIVRSEPLRLMGYNEMAGFGFPRGPDRFAVGLLHIATATVRARLGASSSATPLALVVDRLMTAEPANPFLRPFGLQDRQFASPLQSVRILGNGPGLQADSDFSSLVLLSTSVRDGETLLASLGRIEAVFSGSIQSSTVTPESVVLTKDGTERVPGDAEIGTDAQKITFRPLNPLGPGNYVIEFSSSIRDVSESGLSGDTTVRFQISLPVVNADAGDHDGDGEFTSSDLAIRRDQIAQRSPGQPLMFGPVFVEGVPAEIEMEEGERLAHRIRIGSEGADVAVSIRGAPFAVSRKAGTIQQLILEPGFGDSGTYQIQVEAAFEDGRKSVGAVAVKVVEKNRPPLLTPLHPPRRFLACNEGELLSFTVKASDADLDFGKEVLQFAFNAATLPNLPPPKIDTNLQTATFSFEPTFKQAGRHEIQIEVRDMAGEKGKITVDLMINDINRKPEFRSNLPISPIVVSGETTTITFTAADPDGDPTNLSLFESAKWNLDELRKLGFLDYQVSSSGNNLTIVLQNLRKHRPLAVYFSVEATDGKLTSSEWTAIRWRGIKVGDYVRGAGGENRATFRPEVVRLFEVRTNGPTGSVDRQQGKFRIQLHDIPPSPEIRAEIIPAAGIVPESFRWIATNGSGYGLDVKLEIKPPIDFSSATAVQLRRKIKVTSTEGEFETEVVFAPGDRRWDGGLVTNLPPIEVQNGWKTPRSVGTYIDLDLRVQEPHLVTTLEAKIELDGGGADLFYFPGESDPLNDAREPFDTKVRVRISPEATKLVLTAVGENETRSSATELPVKATGGPGGAIFARIVEGRLQSCGFPFVLPEAEVLQSQSVGTENPFVFYVVLAANGDGVNPEMSLSVDGWGAFRRIPLHPGRGIPLRIPLRLGNSKEISDYWISPPLLAGVRGVASVDRESIEVLGDRIVLWVNDWEYSQPGTRVGQLEVITRTSPSESLAWTGSIELISPGIAYSRPMSGEDPFNKDDANRSVMESPLMSGFEVFFPTQGTNYQMVFDQGHGTERKAITPTFDCFYVGHNVFDPLSAGLHRLSFLRTEPTTNLMEANFLVYDENVRAFAPTSGPLVTIPAGSPVIDNERDLEALEETLLLHFADFGSGNLDKLASTFLRKHGLQPVGIIADSGRIFARIPTGADIGETIKQISRDRSFVAPFEIPGSFLYAEPAVIGLMLMSTNNVPFEVGASFSDPLPVVALKTITRQDVTVSGKQATVRIEGHVTDAIADIVAGQRADIKQMLVEFWQERGETNTAGLESALVNVNRSTNEAPSALRPFAFKGTFSKSVTIPIRSGETFVSVSATNLIGNRGQDSFRITVSEAGVVTSVLNHEESGPGLVNPIRVVVNDPTILTEEGKVQGSTLRLNNEEFGLKVEKGEVQMEQPIMALRRDFPTDIPNLLDARQIGQIDLNYRGVEVSLSWTNEMACCGIVSNIIYYPITKDPLIAAPLQESIQDEAIGAHQVWLHDGAFFETQEDLAVKSVGFPFRFVRTYRSNVRTTKGGLIGHGWDFNFNKRLVPIAEADPETGLFFERIGKDRAQVQYLDGSGRMQLYTEQGSGARPVRTFGSSFEAYVTTYTSPPGSFHELQRYILANPANHPFRSFEAKGQTLPHPNVDTSNGESIFYVLREKDGFRNVFNCRGQLIFAIDRNENRMTFIYTNEVMNPLTQNPFLSRVIDTAGREYVIEPTFIGEGDLFTNNEGALLAHEQSIPRIKSITDFDGRRVVFNYGTSNAQPVLTSVVQEFGDARLATIYGYERGSSDTYLLTSITAPRESASSGVPYLQNFYEPAGEGRFRVSGQRLGPSEFSLSYSGNRIQVIDPNENLRAYDLLWVEAGPVIHKSTLTGSSGPDRGPWLTEFFHNPDGQRTEIKFPRGNHVTLHYEALNKTIIQPGRWAGENSLSKGNLKRVTRHSHLPGDPYPSISFAWEHEIVFNQVASETDPRGATTKYEYRYDQPGYFGNPIKKSLPPLTRAFGGLLTDLTERYDYATKGLLVSVENTAGKVTRFDYDQKTGYLERIRFPIGSQLFTNDSRGNVIATVSPRGVVTTYSVDERDFVTTRTEDAMGFKNVTSYAQDLNGNLVLENKERKDNFSTGTAAAPVPSADLAMVQTWVYDMLNRPIRHVIGSARIQQEKAWQYDGNGNRVIEVNSSPTGTGTVTNRFLYDGRNLLVEKREAAGTWTERTTQFGYDHNGNIQQVTKPGARVSAYTYDGFDRLIVEQNPVGGIRRFGLDPNGNVVSSTFMGSSGVANRPPELLKRQEADFDAFNNQIRQRTWLLDGTAGVVHTAWQYNRALLVEEQNGPGIRNTKYDYNEMNWLVKETDAEGNSVVTEYLDDGNRRTVVQTELEKRYDKLANNLKTSIAGYRFTFEYDSLGRVIRQQGPNGSTTHFYDSFGSARGILDEFQKLTQIEYDGLNRQHVLRSGDVTLTNDYVAGQFMRAVISSQRNESWVYDELGRVLAHRNHLTDGVTSTRYDAAGNPRETTDPNGTVVTRTFNSLNLPVSIQVKPGGIKLAAVNEVINTVIAPGTETFAYDSLGRPVIAQNDRSGTVWRRYDGLDRVIADTSTIRGATHTFQRSTSPDSSLQILTYPSIAGGMKLENTYDRLGRLVEIQQSIFSAAKYQYSGSSRVAHRSSENQVHTYYNYDEQRRLNELRVVLGSAGLSNAIPVLTSLIRTYNMHQPATSEEFLYLQGRQQLINTAIRHDSLGRQVQTSTSVTDVPNEGLPTLASVSEFLQDYDQSGRPTQTAECRYEGKPGFFGGLSFSMLRHSAISYANGRVQRNFIRAERGGIGEQITHQQINIPDISAMLEPTVLDGPDHEQTQEFQYDNNGNLIKDKRFIYSYDHNNRLTEVYDQEEACSGYHRTLAIHYDSFGRRILTHVKPKATPGPVCSELDFKPPWHPTVGYIYDDNRCIAEIGFDHPDRPGTYLLARYIYGARDHELLRMDRLYNDNPTNAVLLPYYFHEGLHGELKLTTSSATHIRPLVPQEVGERFPATVLQGSLTRSPYRSWGTRSDTFAGITYDQRLGTTIFDFQSIPELDREVAEREALAQSITKGLTIAGTIAVLALSAPVAPYMVLGGVVAMGLDYGYHTYKGADYSQEYAGQAFMAGAEVGALVGGFGNAVKAGVAAAGASATASARFTAGATAFGREAATELSFGAALRADDIIDSALGYLPNLQQLAEMDHGDNCFLAGTLVETTEGMKPIEEVKVGDRVTPPLWHQNCPNPRCGTVERLFRNTTDQIVTLTIGPRSYAREHRTRASGGDEEPGGEESDEPLEPDSQTIGCTPGHPFFVEGKGWVFAGDLRAGDAFEARGEHVVGAVEAHAERAETFNFEVRCHHTYRVGTGQILVHNSSTRKSRLLKAAASERGMSPDVQLNRAIASPTEGEYLHVGRYGKNYRANRKAGKNSYFVGDHILQDALNSRLGRWGYGMSPIRHSQGSTLNIFKSDHAIRRTTGVPVEDLLSLRNHLAADLRDVRRILLNSGIDRSLVNQQLKTLVRQIKSDIPIVEFNTSYSRHRFLGGTADDWLNGW